MEDILASIRKILSEDDPAALSHAGEADREPAPRAVERHPETRTQDDDVLDLDEAMMVDEPFPQAEMPAPAYEPAPLPVAPPPAAQPAVPPEHLVAPAAAAGVSASVGSLVRRIAAERATQVHRGGPTIEDLVREELRPVVKEWLDTHLPPLVERLVAAEIERVIGRATL